MKMRNKSKGHRVTSSSSSLNPNKNPFSVLNLLPAAIITLLSVLCIEEREVLAYMITRSLKSADPPARYKQKSAKKQSFGRHGHISTVALFECDCFQCYISFWYRWDSSPNCELIHDAIEAFEEHLNNGGVNKLRKDYGGRNKREEKMGRRKIGNVSGGRGGAGGCGGVVEFPVVEKVSPADMVPEVEVTVEKRGAGEVVPPVLVVSDRSLVRKVLPDFMGLFNSRFWSLWNSNM